MPTIALAAFAVLILFGILNTITQVGKPRGPITPGVAAAVAFIGMLELLVLAYLSTQL